MVNPEISRSVARLIPMLTALGMSIDERLELANKVENITDLSELDPKYLNKINLAKKLVQEGISELKVMQDPEKYMREFGEISK